MHTHTLDEVVYPTCDGLHQAEAAVCCCARLKLDVNCKMPTSTRPQTVHVLYCVDVDLCSHMPSVLKLTVHVVLGAFAGSIASLRSDAPLHYTGNVWWGI